MSRDRRLPERNRGVFNFTCNVCQDNISWIQVFNFVLYKRDLLPQEAVRRAICGRGQAYFFEERFELAIRDFDEALLPSFTGLNSSAEMTGYLHIHRAAALRKLGRLTESKESYDKYKRLASTRGYPIPESEGAETFQSLLEWNKDIDTAVYSEMGSAITDRVRIGCISRQLTLKTRLLSETTIPLIDILVNGSRQWFHRDGL